MRVQTLKAINAVRTPADVATLRKEQAHLVDHLARIVEDGKVLVKVGDEKVAKRINPVARKVIARAVGVKL